MPKTTEVTINCNSISVKADSRKVLEVTLDVEDLDMSAILQKFDDEDIIRYVKNNIDPDDVYPSDTLSDWAERNGYTKIDQD